MKHTPSIAYFLKHRPIIPNTDGFKNTTQILSNKSYLPTYLSPSNRFLHAFPADTRSERCKRKVQTPLKVEIFIDK